MSERVAGITAASDVPTADNGDMTTQPDVTRSWLRFDDVLCVRCKGWAGPEGDRVWVVDGEGCVCDECVTDDEKARAHDQR